LQDFAEWNLQVCLDVVSQGFQRRNIQNFRAVAEFAGERLANHAVNAGEKCGQCFA